MAPATPMGAAPRAVLRLSGPHLLDEAGRYLAFCKPLPAKRRQVLEVQLEPLPGIFLLANLLVFPGPHSATGEDVCELHMPSSPPLVAAQLQQLLACGCRLAEPGEFTRRAFMHGRLDLTQAEAVLELVEARSSAAAKSATQVLGGSLGSAMRACRAVLIEALMELEAGLDFEEGDSQDLAPGEVKTLLQRATTLLQSGLLAEQQRMLRHGGRFRIALLGAPNAGKSTLFGALTGTPSLISADVGTTRDWREASWQPPASPLPLTLVDYPGLGGVAIDARDLAARELAQQSLAGIDLVWLCVAPETAVAVLPRILPAVARVVVWTQGDRGVQPSAALRRAVLHLAGVEAPQIEVACGSAGALQSGLGPLEAATLAALSRDEQILSDHIAHGHRHQEALSEALQAVAQAAHWDAAGGHQDLVAEELRGALVALALLVGEFTPEDVLDRLFSSFCIGK